MVGLVSSQYRGRAGFQELAVPEPAGEVLLEDPHSAEEENTVPDQTRWLSGSAGTFGQSQEPSVDSRFHIGSLPNSRKLF